MDPAYELAKSIKKVEEVHASLETFFKIEKKVEQRLEENIKDIDRFKQDLVRTVQGTVSSKTYDIVDIPGLRAELDNISPEATAWGNISGTLSAQTDLQAALDAKANSLGVDDNYVTDAEKTVIGNTSNTNTGDQDLSGYFNKSTDDTSDITEATDKNFVTDAEKTVIGNTSNTNTGDQTIPVTGVDFDPVGTDNSDNNAVNTRYANDYRSGDDPTFGDMIYDTAISTPSALGSIGATETIDWATGTHFTITLDANTTITHSNETSGQKITLVMSYTGAERTITWSDVDEWAGGSAPAEPASGETLIVTLLYVGSTCYGSGEIFS